MKVIKPSVEVIKLIPEIDVYKHIERCGRICYKSEARITSDSYDKLIKGLIVRGHLSVVEHVQITAIVTCDRGVSHEIVRHRIGSYSQTSTRYVNYKSGIEVIQPPIKDSVALAKWEASMLHAENTYKDMIERAETAEIARSVLPNSLKTTIAMTYNIREWRHFLQLRLSKASHPQIREIASLCLIGLYDYVPLFFEDMLEKERISCPI